MRIAILSDIHGNTIALDAVLADIADIGGVDAYWILGDLVALGPDPVGVLDRLLRLPNLHAVRGNTDRYTVTGQLPPVMETLLVQDSIHIPTALTIARSFGWTCGALTTAGYLEWVRALPLEYRTRLPNGTWFLGVHAAPGQDDGEGLNPGIPAEELTSLLADAHAELVCVGHTHWFYEVRQSGHHVVNLGSVSNPLAPDLRASYCLLTTDAHAYQIHHRRVAYDHAAVIAALVACQHPSAAFLCEYQLGQKWSRWSNADA